MLWRRELQSALAPRHQPARSRSPTPAVPEKDAGSCAERLGTVPLSSFALAPRGWAPASVATGALAKSFDLPRAPMSRRGRAHVLSLEGLHRVRETRYCARQTLHQVGRWTAPPSCGPCSAAATCLLAEADQRFLCSLMSLRVSDRSIDQRAPILEVNPSPPKMAPKWGGNGPPRGRNS